MGKMILEDVPNAFAVASDSEWSKSNVEHSSPVFIGVLAVFPSGIGHPASGRRVVVFALVGIGVVISATDSMVNTWITCEKIYTQLDERTDSDLCRGGTITVTVVGGKTSENVVAYVEHIVVLIRDPPMGIAKDDHVGGLFIGSVIKRCS